MKTKEFFTEVFGLNFKINGSKICFMVKNKPHWVRLGKRSSKALEDILKAHISYEELCNNMSYAEKAEMYKEYGGS